MKQLTLILTVALFATTHTQAQNVGIGTTSPARSFHINSGTLLITGDTGTVPNLPSGGKFFWSPAKSAFRAGSTTGTQWDYANIGVSSMAFGKNSNASGNNSFAGGEGTIVSGTLGFASGFDVTVAGDYSAAFGVANTINSPFSFSAGFNNAVNAHFAAAIGNSLQANSYNSFVIGRLNKIEGSNSWVATEPAFVIGNGEGNVRSNAFSVAKNGNMKVAGNADISGASSVTGNSTVSGTSYALGGSILAGTTTAYGTTNLNGVTNVDNTLNITNGNIIEANLVSGTAPLMNLVPVGVVQCRMVYQRLVTSDNCNPSFSNIAGNFISSSQGICDAGVLTLDGQVSIRLYFNTSQVTPFKEIIAVPSITYNAFGSLSDAKIVKINSSVVKNTTTNKPQYYIAGFETDEMPELGNFIVEGTVMFYGLK